jgi:hypothetical protein
MDFGEKNYRIVALNPAKHNGLLIQRNQSIATAQSQPEA